MAFTKRNYVSGETVITADNLNAIQDELIRVGGLLGKDIQSATINDSGHLILTLTDDTTLDAGVAKGAQGEKGATGPAGPQGPAGTPGNDGAKGDTGPSGADGVTPHIGDNGNWYLGDEDTGVAAKGAKGDTGAQGPKGDPGAKGDTGAQGPKGDDGHTPVKGTDYWTEADKQEIVNIVIAALPDGTEVAY